MTRHYRIKYIYFIKPVHFHGPIKVGCSADPSLRRTNIAAMSPFELEIVARMRGDFELEGRIHAYLVDDHERQEWFRPSDRVNGLIAAINAGTFDPAILPENRGPVRHLANAKSKDTPAIWEYRPLYNAFNRVRYAGGLKSGRFKHHLAPSALVPLSATRQAEELAAIKNTLAHYQTILAESPTADRQDAAA